MFGMGVASLRKTGFSPDADPETATVDGWAGRDGADTAWATLHGFPGNANQSSTPNFRVKIEASTTTNQWASIRRGIVLFDIGSVTGLIVGARLRVTPAVLTDTYSGSVSLVGSTPASNTNLVDADYQQVGATKYAADKTLASLVVDTETTFQVTDQGILHLRAVQAGDGIAKFGFRITADADNSPPSWSSGGIDEVRFYARDNGASFPVLDVYWR